MAQAVTVTTPTPFIAKLLAPTTAPLDAKAARAYRRELRREMEAAWSYVYHRYHAADAYRRYCSHAFSAAVMEHCRLDVPEAKADRGSFRALVDAVHALMLVPAPTIGALRLKQKLERVDGGRETWAIAIAADCARLASKEKPL